MWPRMYNKNNTHNNNNNKKQENKDNIFSCNKTITLVLCVFPLFVPFAINCRCICVKYVKQLPNPPPPTPHEEQSHVFCHNTLRHKWHQKIPSWCVTCCNQKLSQDISCCALLMSPLSLSYLFSAELKARFLKFNRSHSWKCVKLNDLICRKL